MTYSDTNKIEIKSSLGNHTSNLLVLKDISIGENEKTEVHIFSNNIVQGTISIECDIVISNDILSGDNEEWVMTFGALGSSSGAGCPAIFNIVLKETGYTDLRTGTTIPYLVNQKQYFQITIDTNEQIYNIIINGVNFISNREFNNSDAVNFNALFFESFWDSKVIFGIDNIVVRMIKGHSA